jgi:predicted DNA-binding protein YlxM (UPF0122 family)
MDLPEARQQKNMLFDFYESLLTDLQREIFSMRNIEDFSLAEIGVEKNITPQAVSDMLKRTEKRLNSYEEKLGLVAKHEKRQSAVLLMKSAFDDLVESGINKAFAKKLHKLLDSID